MNALPLFTVKMSDTDRVDRSMKKLIGCFQRSDVTGANMALSESIDVMMKNDDVRSGLSVTSVLA